MQVDLKSPYQRVVTDLEHTLQPPSDNQIHYTTLGLKMTRE